VEKLGIDLHYLNPIPIFEDSFPIPSGQIPVPATQIPFSQSKNRSIPVPILPLQDPLNSAIEKLHLKFCKRVLGVHSKSTNMAIYAELGRTPLIVQIAKLVVKYWFRTKSSLLANALVRKAANVYMELNLKPTIFLKYALQLCEGENCNSQTELSNLQTELSDTEKGSVCHYVKHRFKEAFILYWAEPVSTC
jgi:hypothetical protein